MKTPIVQPYGGGSLSDATGQSCGFVGFFDEGVMPDEVAIPSAQTVDEEIATVLKRDLSDDLQRWVDEYARVGDRDPYLWKWCRCGVEITTLPCISPAMREELCDTKVLGVMLDVLMDDVADQHGDETLLEHLLCSPYGRPQSDLSQFAPQQRAYAQFTDAVWQEIQRRVRQYPRFGEYADLLRYDYLQLFNTMRYSHLLNGDLALLNLAEHDLYLPHNMHMMISATVDLMCSPEFDRTELGLLREAVWNAQYMGRIGNLVTTWERELREGDYTSGVFASAVSRGDLAVADLLSKETGHIEAAIRKGDHEDYFLQRWGRHRHHLASLQKKLRSVDLGPLLEGLERLICLHMGSRGKK